MNHQESCSSERRRVLRAWALALLVCTSIGYAVDKGFSCSGSGGCVTKISQLPFVIQEPGLYCLANDCKIKSDCDAAITIETGDVVVDMGGFVIDGGNIGIEVISCVSTVAIKNGGIRNTQAEGILVGKGCKNIEIICMTVINTNQSQNNNQGLPVCLPCGQIPPCSGLGAVVLQGTSTDSIKNSRIENVTVDTTIGAGIMLQFCNNCKVIDCLVLNAASSAQLDATGFYVSGSGDLFEWCKAASINSNNQGMSARGFFAQVAQNVSYKNCHASKAAATATGFSAIGFDLINGECAVYEECTADTNISLSTTPVMYIQTPSGQVRDRGPLGGGFASQDSAGTLFVGCVAMNNGTPTTNPAIIDPTKFCNSCGFGLAVMGDSGSCIKECIALNNLGNGILFFDATDKSFISECTAAANVYIGINNLTQNEDFLGANAIYSCFASGNDLGDATTVDGKNIELYNAAHPTPQFFSGCVISLGCQYIIGANIDGDLAISVGFCEIV